MRKLSIIWFVILFILNCNVSGPNDKFIISDKNKYPDGLCDFDVTSIPKFKVRGGWVTFSFVDHCEKFDIGDHITFINITKKTVTK